MSRALVVHGDLRGSIHETDNGPLSFMRGRQVAVLTPRTWNGPDGKAYTVLIDGDLPIDRASEDTRRALVQADEMVRSIVQVIE